MQVAIMKKYLTKAIKLPNGKRKYIRGKTQEELDKKVDALKREMLLGIDVSDETKFRDYTDQWFKTTRSVGLNTRTVSRLEGLLKNYIYPVIGDMKLRDIRPAHIRAIMSKVSGKCHGLQSTVLSLLTNAFNLAVDDNIILRSPVSPTTKAKGKTEDEAEPLTPEQEEALLSAAQGKPIYSAVFILLHTGLRRGELLGLMWTDIDYEEHVIHVRRHVVPDKSGAPILEAGAKTDAGVRDVPMPDVLAAYLKGMTMQSVYVFPNSKGELYSTSAFSSVWKTLDEHAGFHTHPHQLRHTYATKLFESGLDIKQVQYVMGHADPNITLKTYTHYRDTVRKQSTIQQVREAFV